MKFEMNSEYSFGFIYAMDFYNFTHMFICIRIPTKNIKI